LQQNKYECPIDQELPNAGVQATANAVFTRQAVALGEMTSWPPSWKYDVISEIRLRQSMHIYLRNNSDKFQQNPIWNDEALGSFWRGRPNNKKIKMLGDMWSVRGVKMKTEKHVQLDK